MTQRNNILQELNELESSLASMGSANPYVLPEGYFDDMFEQLMQKIKAMNGSASEEIQILSPLLSSISRSMPYELPAGYFDNLETTITVLNNSQAHSVADELNELSSLLGGLKKEMPYEVPKGYFEQFETLPAIQPKAKVVSLANRKIFRYAAAAVITAVIAVSGFLISNRNANPEKVLARIEKNANKVIEKTSDKELIDFLETTSSEQDLAINDNKEELNDILKDVPATELEQFLNEIAEPEN